MADALRFPVTVELDADTYAVLSTYAARIGSDIPAVIVRELQTAADAIALAEDIPGYPAAPVTPYDPWVTYPTGQAVAIHAPAGWTLAAITDRLADGHPVRARHAGQAQAVDIEDITTCLPASGVPDDVIGHAAGYFPTQAALAAAARPLRQAQAPASDAS